MSETKITITPNAPYKIDGEFTIEENGEKKVVLTNNKSTYLCSCGLSEKKPYCDGSHTKCEPKNIFTEPTIS